MTAIVEYTWYKVNDDFIIVINGGRGRSSNFSNTLQQGEHWGNQDRSGGNRRHKEKSGELGEYLHNQEPFQQSQHFLWKEIQWLRETRLIFAEGCSIWRNHPAQIAI